MNNQRKFNRYNLFYDLEALDDKTSQTIGHLTDISIGGAMLISESPISVGTRLKLNIVLPAGFGDQTHLSIDAECVRSNLDVNPDYFNIGLHFLGINQQHQEIIESLIENYQL